MMSLMRTVMANQESSMSRFSASPVCLTTQAVRVIALAGALGRPRGHVISPSSDRSKAAPETLTSTTASIAIFQHPTCGS